MKTVPLLCCLLLLSSCFLFREYRRTAFRYTTGGQTAMLPLIVPRGMIRQERIDTAGISIQTFHYPGGAVLYSAYLTDTAIRIQPFDTSVHQPLVHRLGGWVFKGQDEEGRYYREIRQGNFRFGYRSVSPLFEWYFDSATNHASLQRR